MIYRRLRLPAAGRHDIIYLRATDARASGRIITHADADDNAGAPMLLSERRCKSLPLGTTRRR